MILLNHDFLLADEPQFLEDIIVLVPEGSYLFQFSSEGVHLLLK